MQNNKTISLIDKVQDPNTKINSKFLAEYYEENKKSNIKKMGFNPRDPLGRRLSLYWAPGDTIFSVSMKKTGNFFYHLLNPDTYCVENVKKIKRKMVLYDVELIFGGSMIVLFLLIYLPFIQPRAQRAKEEYLIHQFFKKRFFEEELALGKKHVRLSKMKEILKKIHEEYKAK